MQETGQLLSNVLGLGGVPWVVRKSLPCLPILRAMGAMCGMPQEPVEEGQGERTSPPVQGGGLPQEWDLGA